MGTRFSDIDPELEVFLEPEYNSDGTLKTSKKVNDHILNHIVSVETERRNYDSAIKDYEDLIFTKEKIENNLIEFNRNYGKFCDGKLLRLNVKEYYFKLTSNIAISIDNGIKRESFDQKLFSLLNVYDRSTKERPTISLFVNNLKVPDSEIYVYMGETKTDILFPLKYIPHTFNQMDDKIYEDTPIYIEKRIYPKYQYVNRYIKNIQNNSISITLEPEENNNSRIDAKTVMIYSNGILLTGTRSVQKTGLNVTISSNEIISGRNIEVIFDSDIKTINSVDCVDTNRCIFNLHEDDLTYKINYLYGAIPKKNCYFFINGRRISNNSITQVGRMNFIKDELIPSAYKCTLIYTDRDYINESEKYIYGDDYYLSNFLGVQNVSRLMNGESINQYINLPDLKFDFHQIMNLNGNRYKPEYVKSIHTMTTQYKTYEAVTKELLKKSNHLIRDFLNLYGKREIYKNIIIGESDPIPETYTLTFNAKRDINEPNTMSYFYIVDINGKHIKDTDISIIDTYQYNHVKIHGSVLSKGYNKIHVREFKFDSQKESAVEYQIFNTSNITQSGDVYTYNIPKLISLRDVDDLLCLDMSHNEPGVYYDPGDENKMGWMTKPDVSFQLNDNDTISIIFETLPKSDIFAIYSRRFCMKHTTTIEKDIETITDLTIPIRSRSVDKLPIIPIGGYTVYLNDKLLFNGIDYVFRHPGNYSKIAYTSLGLKRRFKVGDVITVYFNNVKNEIIGRSNDILSKEGAVNNKYGLIYFGKLAFPYSPRYIDLYINGKYIYPDEIDILSDKLIRVHTVPNPMYDIYAETAFGVDPIKLKSFFTYVNTPLENAIATWFNDFDFSELTNPADSSLGNYVYESFDSNVDSIGRLPNPLNQNVEQQIPKRYNLLENAYLLWLKSSAVKTIMNTKNINQDIVNFFKFYTEESRITERQDIVVSARNTRLFNYVVFNSKKYSFNNKERIRRLIHFAKYYSIGSRDLFIKYRDYHKLSNVLYPRDLPKVISSKSLIDKKGKDIILGGRVSRLYKPHDNI